MAQSEIRTVVESLGGAAAIGATVLLSPLLRPWYGRWGATHEERTRRLPGDDLVPSPRLQSTRAVTVRAPASGVWPWLVQMGQGRGGLYSHDRLENLAGCRIQSANRILPAFQHLEPGDHVRLGPEGYPFFVVESVDPGRALVLEAGAQEGAEAAARSTWVFVLDEVDEATSRLIVRNRLDYESTWVNRLIWRVFTDPISFVMERKMLLGVKRRAEATALE
jgi:hypothetical protein